MKKRDFIKSVGAGTVAAVAATGAPFVHAEKKTPIKWRLQTYAGQRWRNMLSSLQSTPSIKPLMGTW